MSLSTLLEAAKYLEMQEQQQKATQESTLTTATIRPVASVNGGSAHLQNGTTGTAQTITVQLGKIINTTTPQTSVANIQNSQTQPTQTVVISSNNISSTFLQGVQGPISFATATPITSTPQTTPQNGTSPNGISQTKKEQDGHISSTTLLPNQRPPRVLNNSFDIINPLVIDESNPAEQKKIKQPPMVFRSGTREVHNKLEKHRRAHLKECFDFLKKQLPANGDEKKTSNLNILHSSLKYIQILKRRERECDHEMERLAREKINNQQRLAILKKEISSHFDNVDFSKILPEIPPNTTSLTQSCNATVQCGGIHVTNNPHSNSASTVINNAASANIITNVGTESTRTEPVTTSVSIGEIGNVNGGTVVSSNTVISQSNTVITNGENKISIPILSKTLPIVTTQAPGVTSIKEVTQPIQTTGISVLPMPYPVNQGLVVQKVAIVPHKGITDLTPIVSTHFITTPQQLNGINGQLNGKVVPITQYLVKPVVVVSTASPRPGS
ncbi:uncharacterized protein LOC143193987 isoform X2 [Rhynchophorus ferrugineus]|uniref:Max-binding protein MNT n=1 Tax=Rhynchophorus ferrugineus TaxID=354439 RepID=A0A834ISM3_RHYFE|nr:hypothetical protein GWI33_009981 [Rhynchophorus ferrugineus]